MKFTYDSYRKLISELRGNGYRFTFYGECNEKKSVIMRHDIDFSLSKAYEMARIESDLGVKSTFFFLLTSDFYNVLSINGEKIIGSILACGHDIGLHFDEQRYPEYAGILERIKERILYETALFSKTMGVPITKVSMHRPSKNILENDLSIPGIVNTYSKKYTYDYKYLSDSRRLWREPVDELINLGIYDRLQILVHPFWYNDKEKALKESLIDFLKVSINERYYDLDNNFTNLKSIVGLEDVLI